MKLTINSETRTFENVRTLPEVIAALGLPAALLLIEHNGTALHRSEWENATLRDGDRLEILRVAAGG